MQNDKEKKNDISFYVDHLIRGYYSANFNYDRSVMTMALLCGAVRISEGFRTLFNLPESIALLRGDGQEGSYWRLSLRHCLEGNIQSLLDEQVHCLVESLGVIDESETERAETIGDSIGSSLSIRTSQLQLDEVAIRPESRKIELEGYNTRCRFALRFGELKDDKGAAVRADTVRDAFNSPFDRLFSPRRPLGRKAWIFIPGVIR